MTRSDISALKGVVTTKHANLKQEVEHLTSLKEEASCKVDDLKEQLVLIEKTQQALKDVLPLLLRNSITECEELANKAIQQVFGLDYKVRWDAEGSRFILDKGDMVTDLVEGEGGGMSTLISFVFTVFLLNKMGKRKFMAFDEAFTQVSATYFPQFLDFVRELCHTLEVDLMLISHDQRITLDDVDTAYRVENNTITRIK